MKTNIFLFGIFALMVPLGVVFGTLATQYLTQYPLVEPIFSALAAGTFLYLGTLHGLKHAVMIEKCCDLRRFTLVIIGFAIMAVVAVWT
jgi:zinc transporter ZupT